MGIYDVQEQIVEIIKESKSPKDARAKAMFLLCFNLLDDECNYSSGELRSIIMDELEKIEENI